MEHVRRCYTIWINPDHIVELFSLWNRHSGCFVLPQMRDAADDHGNRVHIPDDVTVYDATYDWNRHQIGIRITHDSFPVTPDGEYSLSLRLIHIIHHVRPTRQDDADGPIIMEISS